MAIGLRRATDYDQNTLLRKELTVAQAHSVEYACAAVPKCAVVNSAGQPLPPLQIPLPPPSDRANAPEKDGQI